MKFLKSKESVGKVALALTSATTIAFGGLLVNSNAEGEEKSKKLDEAKIQMHQKDSDYDRIEKKLSDIEAQGEKLSSQVDKLEKDNKSLKEDRDELAEKNKDLEVRLRRKQLREAQEKRERELQEQKNKSAQAEKSKPVEKRVVKQEVKAPVQEDKKVEEKKTEVKAPAQEEKKTEEPRVVEKRVEKQEEKPVVQSRTVEKRVVAETKSEPVEKRVENKTEDDLSGWRKITVVATAYSLIGDPSGSNGTPYTATGTYPQAGRTIAVDPSLIPYGSQIKIPSMGNGIYKAEDTGGAINGNRIDIYMSNGDLARQFGRQTIEIYVKR
ncbi:3D domain-containing protein [Priestia megaterium]|uniref:3D domain-containing protein n=1 Tax=Priestia megaterium TaxID=1404 RepID=UPI002E205C66|nr:3D domain-containing protein [Priestia megaterium]MED3976106.1 3D domain-containing protein [Priestia megaterium]